LTFVFRSTGLNNGKINRRRSSLKDSNLRGTLSASTTFMKSSNEVTTHMHRHDCSCADAAKAGGRWTPAKKTILMVDDERPVREMLSRVLIGENYSVLAAENGEVALRLAATSHVDLVMLDLNMPVKGGWDTFERLTTENPLLPVIIVTARPNQFFTAASSGAGALLEKPLDFPLLLETIRDLLDEPTETRLARMAGRDTVFRYRPANPSAEGN